MKLAEDVPADEVVRRLQEVTLDGIDWLGGVALGDNDCGLGGVVERARLWALLPAGADAAAGLAASRARSRCGSSAWARGRGWGA